MITMSGRSFSGKRDGRLAVLGLGRHGHVRLLGDQRPEALAHQFMIVRKKYLYVPLRFPPSRSCPPRSARSGRSCVPPAGDCSRSSQVPPSRFSRSCTENNPNPLPLPAFLAAAMPDAVVLDGDPDERAGRGNGDAHLGCLRMLDCVQQQLANAAEQEIARFPLDLFGPAVVLDCDRGSRASSETPLPAHRARV